MQPMMGHLFVIGVPLVLIYFFVVLPAFIVYRTIKGTPAYLRKKLHNKIINDNARLCAYCGASLNDDKWECPLCGGI